MRSILLNTTRVPVTFAAAVDAGTPATTVSATGSTIALRAMDFASRSSENFSEDMESFVRSKEELDGSPIVLMFDLRDDFPDVDEDGVPQNAGLSSWPMPDTLMETKQPDGKIVKLENADKYEAFANDGTEIKGSFYGDLLDHVSFGKKVAEIKLMISNVKKKAEVPSIYMYLTRMTDMDLKAEENRINSNRTTALNKLKRAVKLHFQMKAVEDKLPKVGVRFAEVEMYDDKGAPIKNPDGSVQTTLNVRTPNPIVLWNIEKGDSYKNTLSIGTFLSLNVQAAADAGGRLPDLMATAKRGTKDGKKKKGATDTQAITVSRIPDFKTAEQYLAETVAYFDDQTEAGQKHLVELSTKLGAKDSDALLETVGDLCMVFDHLWTKVKDRYTTLKADKAASKVA